MGYLTTYLDSASGAEGDALDAALRARLVAPYATPKTTDATLSVGDLASIVAVDTSTSVITITLPDPAAAGHGATAIIEKTDATTGYVRVLDDDGSWLEELYWDGAPLVLQPNSDLSAWNPINPPGIQRRPGGNRYWPPFSVLTANGNGAAVALDTIYCHLIDLESPRIIDALGLSVFSTLSTNTQFKTALYEWDPDSPASPTGAALLASGSTIGTGSSALTKNSYASTFTALQLPRHGRAWACSKVGGTATGTSNAVGTTPGIAGSAGATAALQMAGFSGDYLRGWASAADQTFASSFPSTLPSMSEVTANLIPILFPRIV